MKRYESTTTNRWKVKLSLFREIVKSIPSRWLLFNGPRKNKENKTFSEIERKLKFPEKKKVHIIRTNRPKKKRKKIVNLYSRVRI